MLSMSMAKIRSLGVVWALALMGATSALAGGFWLSTYSPTAPVASHISGAVVVVAAEGCHNPAAAVLSGAAEGLVKGKRRSVTLEFTPTGKPGVYAVKKQWPNEGAWVLAITGKYLGGQSSLVVELEPNGKFRAEPAGKNLASRIESALEALAAKTS